MGFVVSLGNLRQQKLPLLYAAVARNLRRQACIRPHLPRRLRISDSDPLPPLFRLIGNSLFGMCYGVWREDFLISFPSPFFIRGHPIAA